MPAGAQNTDIVIYASDVERWQGNWTRGAASGAANGQEMVSANHGWSSANSALASPADFFEVTFSAPSDTTYHIWLRISATGDTTWSDSVWVQFDDAIGSSGSPAYRIGTTDGLLVNLEPCYACGVGGWGWIDRAYWLSQPAGVRFASSGTHKLRVQTREDGVRVDQIVLSPGNYLTSAPGQGRGDATIVPKSGSAPLPSAGSTPFSGSPVSLPGTIQAENFDNGGQGAAYSDTTSANLGNAYRSTGVDLEPASGGGHNIGWTDAGEWVNYTVNVASAGTYGLSFRVASSGQGGSFHLEMNGANVTGSLTIPDTGGWQTWWNVTATANLSAGTQIARIVMETRRGNFDSITFSQGASGGGSPPGTPTSPNVPNGAVGVTLTPTLSWQASGATSYELRLATSNPPGSYQTNLSTPWTSATLVGATRYYWQVIASNGSGSTAGPVWYFTTEGGAAPAPAPPPPPPSGGQSIRMMTWNIKHGFNAAFEYSLGAQVNFIVSHHPDVVALQEVQTWDENQPQRLKTLFEQATGQTWSMIWAPVTNSAGTEGNVILTRLPVLNSAVYQMHATSNYEEFLSNRSVAGATVSVGGVPVAVFSTHLDYANGTYRTIQLQQLMAWLPNFAGPRLVGGDFNSWWGEQWITTMTSQHTDTWRDVTGGQDLGYTVNNAVRFDYIFRSFDGAWRAVPTNCFVPVTSLSDHNPVIADFNLQ
jgi:endonuclease/exonuclease/phosphatase family metal-dependent hydrolase